MVAWQTPRKQYGVAPAHVPQLRSPPHPSPSKPQLRLVEQTVDAGHGRQSVTFTVTCAKRSMFPTRASTVRVPSTPTVPGWRRNTMDCGEPYDWTCVTVCTGRVVSV
jgi:hypothetical protein